MWTICLNGSVPWNKVDVMYGKTLKNLLQNLESFEAESWYTALGTQSTKFVQMILG